MGRYESLVYYDYQALWEQKKIPKEVYETALSFDKNKDGLNIFEFENFRQRYSEQEEREMYFIPDVEISSRDKLNYMYDCSLPDNIENSTIVTENEKSRLRRRNLIAGGGAIVGLAGTTMMCLSKIRGLSAKVSTRIGVVGLGIAALGIVVSAVHAISGAILNNKLEAKIKESEEP